MSYIPIQGAAVTGILLGMVQFEFEQRSPTVVVNNIDRDDPIIFKLFKVNNPSGLPLADAITADELSDVWATMKRTSGAGLVSFNWMFSIDNQATWDIIASANTNSATFINRQAQGGFTTKLAITHLAFAAFTTTNPTAGEIKELKGIAQIALPAGFSIEEISP